MDKLFSFVDLDRNIVSDEDRETVYKQLEEIGLSPDTAVILFESQNNTLAKVPLDTDSNLPKTLLITRCEPVQHSAEYLRKLPLRSRLKGAP